MKGVEERLDIMEKRLAKAERRASLYRALTVVLVFTMMAGAMVAARRPAKAQDVIKCKKLIITDDSGAKRIVLGKQEITAIKEKREDINTEMLAMYDGQGKQEVVLANYKGAAALVFKNDELESGVTLSLDDDGEGGLLFVNNDINRVQLVQDWLLFEDEKGNFRMNLKITPDESIFNLSTPKPDGFWYNQRLNFAASPDKTVFEVFDVNGKKIFSVP